MFRIKAILVNRLGWILNRAGSGISGSLKGIALFENVKVFALFQSGAMRYSDNQAAGIINNLDL